MVGYRNGVAFDGGEHTPLEILKFETVDLGNAWLLEQIPVLFHQNSKMIFMNLL